MAALLYTLTVISSVLSLVGCLIIIVMFASYQALRSFSVRMLLFLSIADLCAAVSNLLPNDSDGACMFQAILQQYFFLSSFLWTFCVAVNQYLTVSSEERKPWKHELFYHCACWLLPAFSVLALALLGALGRTDLWCWVKDGYVSERWAFFYGPLLAIVLGLIVLFALVMYRLHANNAQLDIIEHNVRASDVGRVQVELTAYLVCFILIRLPSIIHRILEMAGHEPPVVEELHALGSPLQGFANAILFLCNAGVRKFVKLALCKSGRTEDLEKLRVSGSPFWLDSEVAVSDGSNIDETKLLDGAQDSLSNNYTFVSAAEPFSNFDARGRDGWDSFSVFVGTWNMCSKAPPRAPLAADVGDGAAQDDQLLQFVPADSFDIYAVGVQESDFDAKQTGCCDTFRSCWQCRCRCGSSYNTIVDPPSEDHKASDVEDPNQAWFDIVRRLTGENYTDIAVVSLSALRLIVRVRTSLLPKLQRRSVKVSTEATGVGNIGGNKGGTGVSFTLGQTRFCFVNCHFAAHQKHVEARNMDLVQCVGRMNLGTIPGGDFSNQFHCTFLFGDLNYRLVLPRAKILQRIAQHELERMWPRDQLFAIRSRGLLYWGFQEGQITFPPTYKYQLDSDEYSKARNPAWTDRIMWKARQHVQVVQTQYYDVRKIITSDHRPVVGHFRISLPSPGFEREVTDSKVERSQSPESGGASLPLPASTRTSPLLPPAAAAPVVASTAAGAAVAAAPAASESAVGHEVKESKSAVSEGKEVELVPSGADSAGPVPGLRDAPSVPAAAVSITFAESVRGEPALGMIVDPDQRTPSPDSVAELSFGELRCVGARGPRGLPLERAFFTFRAEFLEDPVHTETVEPVPASQREALPRSALPPSLATDALQKACNNGNTLVWQANQMPILTAHVPSAVLGTTCLLLVLRDRELLGEVDVAGTCTIELRAAVLGAASVPAAKSFTFIVPLILDTRPAGFVCGSLSLRWLKPSR